MMVVSVATLNGIAKAIDNDTSSNMINIFSLLLQAPSDFLTKAVRSAAVKRAYAMDAAGLKPGSSDPLTVSEASGPSRKWNVHDVPSQPRSKALAIGGGGCVYALHPGEGLGCGRNRECHSTIDIYRSQVSKLSFRGVDHEIDVSVHPAVPWSKIAAHRSHKSQ
jgi:hypothetical protein